MTTVADKVPFQELTGLLERISQKRGTDEKKKLMKKFIETWRDFHDKIHSVEAKEIVRFESNFCTVCHSSSYTRIHCKNYILHTIYHIKKFITFTNCAITLYFHFQTDSFFPAMRLILPQLDKDREAYGIKEVLINSQNESI